MAEIVGIFAASHTPVMLNFPDAIPDADRNEIFDAFVAMGEDIKSCKADTVVVISDDHLHNFFLDNLPAFCIGAANSYKAPVEHWLKVDKHNLTGDAELGAYLVREAFAAGFDPSVSMELVLDHGILTPLHLAKAAIGTRIVPILVNCVQPPMPTMKRSLQWGRFLGDALRAYPGAGRIAILATGGISHDIATPRMGMVNEEFDEEFLRLLSSGQDDELVRFSTDHVHEAGNGAEEIRTWLLAHGAAGGAPFVQRYYKAVNRWYTGIGLGHWAVSKS